MIMYVKTEHLVWTCITPSNVTEKNVKNDSRYAYLEKLFMESKSHGNPAINNENACHNITIKTQTILKEKAMPPGLRLLGLRRVTFLWQCISPTEYRTSVFLKSASFVSFTDKNFKCLTEIKILSVQMSDTKIQDVLHRIRTCLTENYPVWHDVFFFQTECLTS